MRSWQRRRIKRLRWGCEVDIFTKEKHLLKYFEIINEALFSAKATRFRVCFFCFPLFLSFPPLFFPSTFTRPRPLEISCIFSLTRHHYYSPPNLHHLICVFSLFFDPPLSPSFRSITLLFLLTCYKISEPFSQIWKVWKLAGAIIYGWDRL